MSFISDIGIKLIKYFEGYSSTKYVCVGGYSTIGYGHKLKQSESYEVVDILQAENILNQDLIEVCRGINSMTYPKLLQNQYDAIVSFVFNLGLGAYQRSTLRAKINREEHDLIPHELKKWVYVGAKKSRGLIKRRYIESLIYSEGNAFTISINNS